MKISKHEEIDLLLCIDMIYISENDFHFLSRDLDLSGVRNLIAV